jgi:serine/threonine protein kinase
MTSSNVHALVRVVMYVEELAEFEIASSTIVFGEMIGEGQFGKVFDGALTRQVKSFAKATRVAVKLVGATMDVNEQSAFLKEALRMTKFVHPHIVQLIGVCFKETPSFIVLEYMSGGDLKGYLRDCAPHGMLVCHTGR